MLGYYTKILKESVVIVIISSIMGIISGTFLSVNEEILYAIPIILLILPSLSSLIGDISTVLISRLTSHLYIGIIPPKIQKSDRLREDFFGLLMTIVLGLILLIILGYIIGISTGVGIISPFIMIFILFLTILIQFIFMFIFLFVSSVLLFRRGMDPNNFLIPTTTSLADFLTPTLLVIFIQIFI